MAVYSYTSRLTDLSNAPLTAWFPQLQVRPEEESFGPSGLVSEKPVTVPVNPSTGAFVMHLIPSAELRGGQSGKPGVDYIISARMLDEYSPWFDLWRFTAAVGGGPIHDMVGSSLLAVWVGPPWPSRPSPPGLYIDTTPPNDWGVRS